MKLSALAGDYANYYNWLMDIVGGETWWSEHDRNCIRLFERKYYWRLPIDGTLKNHVIDLRVKAITVGKLLPIFVPNTEPTILEILVVLAINIANDIMYDPERDIVEEVPLYFRDLMEALNFTTDNAYIDQEIDRFLSGETKIADCGRRDTTLWQQCCQLYMERFRIENPEEEF